MKKFLLMAFVLTLIPLLFSSCTDIGNTDANLSVLYLITAVFSLVLLGCCLVVKEKDPWLVVLFVSVLIVNIGYFLLATASTLSFALWANRIAYLGSVALPISMLIIILKTVDIRFKKWVPVTLCCIGTVVFLIAASPGILDVYYKEVSLMVVNGVSVLQKVYGSLHVVNLIYLLSIFSLITFSIVYAVAKKKINSPLHAVILASAVFINIGVWFVEQIVDMDFEILSVSYIISEIFLLSLSVLMAENKKLQTASQTNEPENKPLASPEEVRFPKGTIEMYLAGQTNLTQTERKIFDLHTSGKSTREIMSEMCITENTLKFHNKNIYSKLGVSSKKQLVEIYKYVSTAE